MFAFSFPHLPGQRCPETEKAEEPGSHWEEQVSDLLKFLLRALGLRGMGSSGNLLLCSVLERENLSLQTRHGVSRTHPKICSRLPSSYPRQHRI